MEQDYKIFDKGFNKVLDLIQDVDQQLLNRFKLLLRFMPQQLKDKAEKCEDMIANTEGLNFEMLRTQNSLNIDLNLNGEKYLKNEIYIRRIFDEDLLSDEEEIKIFSIYQRNTKNKISPIVFLEDGGEFKVSNSDENAKEIRIDLYIKKVNNSFVVMKKTNIRGLEMQECKDILELTDMYEYLEVEDEYEEELECYVDLDEDFQNRLN